MSDAAARSRVRKQSWAAPGGAHDAVVRLLKIVLPVLVGILIAWLALAPLAKKREISFILDKNKVDVAKERMRAEAAQYRGEDDEGRPFIVRARSAIQPTSREPLVDINGMSAELLMRSGPARLAANTARYNIENEVADVIGPVRFRDAQGYELLTRDVAVDLNRRTMSGDKGVNGQMPLGRFSADQVRADLAEQRVLLTGRARLHIVQGGVR